MSKAICQTNQDVAEHLLLGYLFFYNLGEVKISESDLEQIFINNGLDSKYVRKISRIDAFRRASSSAKASINVTFAGQNKKAKLEVDEIKCDAGGVLRALGRKLVDEKNEELSYEVVGKVSYDRQYGTVGYTVDPYYRDEYDYEKVMVDVVDRFEEWRQFHNRDTVRNIGNQVLKDMHPVNLLPSGLAKFIPKANKDTLYALRGVINDLNLYGSDCLFEVIPVINTEEQQAMINTAAQREIREELQNFTQELRDVLQKKSVLSSRSAASYVEKFKDLRDKVGEYENLLGVYMNVLTQQIQQAVNLVQANTEA